ncbi:hypothetical protein RSSM_03372 [Rhodopirellula sallentina SM41]|uniref:Uncharacterized protein n=1 Tax=Rhodopirellula sallentina SM41 TaxID=1263870 RepID=M5U170_9BACT|nr:hypothetical protein RSSM_03372 [Rhodopirellula sallentina SM41]
MRDCSHSRLVVHVEQGGEVDESYFVIIRYLPSKFSIAGGLLSGPPSDFHGTGK